MFKEQLNYFAQNVPGFLGGVIIGIDGIPVEERKMSDRFNLETTATEYITLLKKSNQINQQENLGFVKEIVFHNDNSIILLNHINAEYYFIAAFDNKTNLGMIRYKISELIKELSKDIG